MKETIRRRDKMRKEAFILANEFPTADISLANDGFQDKSVKIKAHLPIF